MADECLYCGSEIRSGALIKADNTRLAKLSVEIVNFIHKTDYVELCETCGLDLVRETKRELNVELESKQAYYAANIADFPMMTIGSLPASTEFRVKSMVTANVTVGTGFFNEFSQGFSDLFGAINSTSGMAHKVNSGEAAARSILVRQAVALGANAVIGVDIDYGITANNAATINMQGTAVYVSKLGTLLDKPQAVRAEELRCAISRIAELRRWLNGDFSTDSRESVETSTN
jgi:uncharacterized protein YbjQ (UPF0145 family)